MAIAQADRESVHVPDDRFHARLLRATAVAARVVQLIPPARGFAQTFMTHAIASRSPRAPVSASLATRIREQALEGFGDCVRELLYKLPTLAASHDLLAFADHVTREPVKVAGIVAPNPLSLALSVGDRFLAPLSEPLNARGQLAGDAATVVGDLAPTLDDIRTVLAYLESFRRTCDRPLLKCSCLLLRPPFGRERAK